MHKMHLLLMLPLRHAKSNVVINPAKMVATKNATRHVIREKRKLAAKRKPARSRKPAVATKLLQLRNNFPLFLSSDFFSTRESLIFCQERTRWVNFVDFLHILVYTPLCGYQGFKNSHHRRSRTRRFCFGEDFCGLYGVGEGRAGSYGCRTA